jgi:hypothetical protein
LLLPVGVGVVVVVAEGEEAVGMLVLLFGLGGDGLSSIGAIGILNTGH